METIRTSNAPEPKGAYSQGCVHNGVVYVAGQLGTLLRVRRHLRNLNRSFVRR